MNMQDTILTTPEPSACSTDNKKETNSHLTLYQKQEVKRNLYSLNTSSESLGILSLDDIQPVKDSIISSNYPKLKSLNSVEDRQKILDSTRALLEKYSNRNSNHLGSLSQFNESTVSESDLLKETNIQSNLKHSTMNDSELPRQELSKTPSIMSSTANDNITRNSSFSKQGESSNISNIDSISDYINELKLKMQANSTASFSEIVSDMSKQSIEVDSAMFQPGNEMISQFVEDEKAWKEKYAPMPNVALTSFSSQMNSTASDDKDLISLGEFFQKKSSISFNNSSPVKDPVPLINSTAIDDDNISVASQKLNKSIASILSISDIQNLITGEENTPTKVIECLIKAPLLSSTRKLTSQTLQSHNASPRRHEKLTKDYYNSRASLGSPSVNSKFSKPYASTTDLRSANTTPVSSLYTTKSLSSISNKENMHEKIEEKNRTLTSVRSTSSIGSISDGIPKLDSNKNEIVWGCVKEGRSIIQELTIRNKHNKKVKYLVQISNLHFKPVNLECQGDKAVILLHPWETRQLNIAFTPTSTGPQVGHFYFTPIIRKEELTANRQHIAMYGYGGHANINIKGQTRDLCGKLWVSLGCIDGRQELSTEFIIRNTGTIDGFVSLTVNSKSLCSYDDISLIPSKVIINHGTEQLIKVKFRPSKNDIQSLNEALNNKAMKAAEIGVIRMITGADITRLRIIKINKRILKDSDGKFQDAISQQLSAHFLGSQRKEEIRYFNENPKSIKTLMQCLDSTEISLLVDRDMDATLMPEVDDSTVMFKTMISPDDSSIIDIDHSYMKNFNIEPINIILTPPSKICDYILLSSNHNRLVKYSTNVMPGGPLIVSPSCGHIAPGEIKKVKVEWEFSDQGYRSNKARQDYRVMIQIDEEVLGATVSVINL